MKRLTDYHLQTSIPINQLQRQLIEAIIGSVLQASDPLQAVTRSIYVDADTLVVTSVNSRLDLSNGIRICSIGKAARLMASAADSILGDRVTQGLVIEKSADPAVILSGSYQIMQGGHPIPNERSLAAGEAVRTFLVNEETESPVLFLISGGGSSLVTAPQTGITLNDVTTLNGLMLANPLAIDEINTIRKHIDAVKGGGLLRWLGGSPSISLILSDVLSGDLSMVASGPTCPDESTYADALQIIEKYKLSEQVPPSILRYLQEGVDGHQPETTKPDDTFRRLPNVIEVGSLQQAISAAETEIRSLGWTPIVQPDWLTGQVEQVAERITRDISQSFGTVHQSVLIYGGETTVKPTPNGTGGRNTHLALLMAEPLQMYSGVSLITFATDGEDGNSPAAGAIVDSKTYTNAMQKGIDIRYHQKEFDSYTFFNLLGDALVIGPTGTNVNDLVFILFE